MYASDFCEKFIALNPYIFSSLVLRALTILLIWQDQQNHQWHCPSSGSEQTWCCPLPQYPSILLHFSLHDILHSAQLVSSQHDLMSAFHASGSCLLSSQASPSGQASVHTLKSAFHPPPPPTLLLSRDVPVTDYQFT